MVYRAYVLTAPGGLGGTVSIPPCGSEPGRIGVADDPTGAAFSIVEIATSCRGTVLEHAPRHAL